jgi:hypothetical protein
MSAISELSTIHRVKAKTPEEKRLAAKEAERYAFSAAQMDDATSPPAASISASTATSSALASLILRRALADLSAMRPKNAFRRCSARTGRRLLRRGTSAHIAARALAVRSVRFSVRAPNFRGRRCGLAATTRRAVQAACSSTARPQSGRHASHTIPDGRSYLPQVQPLRFLGGPCGRLSLRVPHQHVGAGPARNCHQAAF